MTETPRAPSRWADPDRAAALVRCIPFLLFIAILALRGAVAHNAGNSPIDPRWLYGLQAGAAFLALLAWRGRYGELRTDGWSPTALLLSLFTGLTVFILWVTPQPPWAHLDSAAAAFVPLDGTGARRWDLIIMRAAGAVLVVPVMEELFWRSFLMRWIDRRAFLAMPPGQVSWLAMGMSSAVFALAHDLWLAGFVAGMAYALLYRRLGKLWYAVIAHASTNLALAAWVIWTGAWQYW